jgi:ferredoxin
MRVRVFVDAERCCGHGRCYTGHPDLFLANEEGEGRPIAAEADSERLAELRLAEAACPEEAISVLVR